MTWQKSGHSKKPIVTRFLEWRDLIEHVDKWTCIVHRINQNQAAISSYHSLISHLGALAARRLSLSWCCRGCRPNSGMWLSLVAGRGWPAESRTAALPDGSLGQMPWGVLPGSSASGWWVSAHRRPHSAAEQCRRGTRKRTLWGRPPSVDLEKDKTGRASYTQVNSSRVDITDLYCTAGSDWDYLPRPAHHNHNNK